MYKITRSESIITIRFSRLPTDTGAQDEARSFRRRPNREQLPLPLHLGLREFRQKRRVLRRTAARRVGGEGGGGEGPLREALRVGTGQSRPEG